MSDQSYQIQIVKRVVVILIIINFITAIFYAMTGSALAVNNPNNTAINTLSGISSSISTNSNDITGSFNAQVFPPATNINITNAIQTFAVWIINFVYKAGIFIISLLALVALSFTTVLVMIFGVIPQLFLNGVFGVFNYIAVTIYGFLLIFIGVYGLEVINDVYRKWFK